MPRKVSGKNNPMFGKPRPDVVLLNKSKEHIDKVTLHNKGRKISEETKKLIGIKSRESRFKLKTWQGLSNPTKLPNYDSSQIKYYLPKKIKKQLLEKYNFICQECHKDFKDNLKLLHVHHIIPRRNGGSDDISNLIIYCQPCHFKKDYNIIKLEKQYNGFKTL